MEINVRELAPEEALIVVDYFHGSTPEHLERMGVDPTRLPPREEWRERLGADFARPLDQRDRLYLVWLADGTIVGFSSCDRITFGERANMHLHVLEDGNRRRGFGAECVRRSVELYFSRLKLKSLYCEPNAFNEAPNRTLQKAGFKYLETYMTVPGPMNTHQAVTRWVIER